MIRKYWTFTLIVCILSLFLYQNVSFAGMTGEHGNAWVAEKEELSNKWNDVDRSVNEYHAMRGHVVTLIDSWDSTKKSVKNGTTVTILTGGAAVISAGVAYLSAGSFAPAAWLAYVFE